MATARNTQPVLIDAVPGKLHHEIMSAKQHLYCDPWCAVTESTPECGLPLGGQTIVTIRNEHLQYIVTWYYLASPLALAHVLTRTSARYALSAITLAMWLVLRNRKPVPALRGPPRVVPRSA
jgi:hypothetical protein